MTAGFLRAEIKEIGASLAIVFCMWVFMGWTESISGFGSLAAPTYPSHGVVKVASVFLRALASTIPFVPIASTFRAGHQDRLSTLVALPIDKLWLGANRYGGIIVVQSILFAGTAITVLPMPATLRHHLLGDSLASIGAKAFVSIGVTALYYLLSDLLPEHRRGLLAFLVVGLVCVLSGVLKPGLFDDPVVVGLVVLGLILLELAAFRHRRRFV